MLDGSSKFSSSVSADALDRHSFPRHVVDVVCHCVGRRISCLQYSDALVAGSFVHENLKALHSGHVPVKKYLQVCMNHFSGSFDTSASSSVGESLRLAFVAHCAPHVRHDSCIAYLDEPTFLQVFDCGWINVPQDVVPFFSC